MTFGPGDEEREKYQSFLDQIQLLKNELQAVRDAVEVDVGEAKRYLRRMGDRIAYVIEEY